MRFELIDEEAVPREAPTICGISAEGIRWRVRVGTREAGQGYSGRFLFEPEDTASFFGPRRGPLMLRGGSREEVVAAAHELSERRLRQLLRSLA